MSTRQKIVLILFIAMFSFSGLVAEEYMYNLKIVQFSEFSDGALIGFDRNPWGGEYSYYSYHVKIKKDGRSDADYNRLLAVFMSAFLTDTKVQIWFNNIDKGETFTTEQGTVYLKKDNLGTINAVGYEYKK